MLLSLLFVSALASLASFGQLERGTITGSITDSTGAVVPGVRVTFRHVPTGDTQVVVANETGQYLRPNLHAGAYELTFEASAFKKLVRSGLTLGLAEVLRVDAVLEVGSVTDTITVSAEVPRLATDAPDVGTSLSNRQLVDLPLTFSGTRNAANFAFKVTPGVVGTEFRSTINGSTDFSKETLLEGATVTTYAAGANSHVMVSVEALSEFKVQTSGLSAEFGRMQAGVFNFGMKSGANEIHGSAYGALRNEVFNANTFANNARGDRRQQDRRQNFAGGFGGPVYLPKLYDGRNRTFFYTTYERYRERTLGFSSPNRTVPLPEFYEGDLSRLLGPSTGQLDAMGRPVPRGAIYDPLTFRQMPGSTRWIGEMFPGNRIPVSRFSKVSRNVNEIAKAGYLPTVRDASGELRLQTNAVFPVSSQPVYDQHLFSMKGDQILNERNRLTASYSYTLRPWVNLDQGGMWDVSDSKGGPLSKARTQDGKGQLARLAHDFTATPSLLNHFVIFYNRFINPTRTVHHERDGAREIGIQGLSTVGFPQINWGGGPLVTFVNPGDPSSNNIANVGWGVLNTISWNRGRHFVKMGFDHRRNHMNRRDTAGGAFNFSARGTAIPNEAFSGNLTGHSFASYLLGIIDSAGLSDPVNFGSRRHYWAAFVQDDFKLTSNFTLSLGVRYEYQPPYFEVANRFSNWTPRVIDPISGLPGAYEFAGDCQGCTGKRIFTNSYKFRDWGPRLGFAWRPVGNWTIRGAYGIFFEGDVANVLSPHQLGKASSVAWGGTWMLSSDAVAPWAGIFNWDQPFPRDRYVPASFDVSWGNANRPGAMDPGYGKNPYIQQWNLNIQRQFAGNIVLDIGYVGTKGTGLRNGQYARVNQVRPDQLAAFGRDLNNAVNNAADAAKNGIAYPFPGFRGTVASALRDYPQRQGNQTLNVYGAPIGFSTYNSLQITMNRQFSRGLSVYSNYVWSKALNNVQSSQPGDNPAGPLDYYNLALEKSYSTSDRPHMLKALVEWELPLGQGRMLFGGANRLVKSVAGGWTTSVILNYFSGTPLGFAGSMPLSGGWNGAANRANVSNADNLRVPFDYKKFDLATLASPSNTYLDKTLVADAAPLTLGTSAPRYGSVRSWPVWNEDFGLRKNQRISEKYRFQIRMEMLNAFNRALPGSPNTSVTSPQFGQITSRSGNRTIQCGVRLDF